LDLLVLTLIFRVTTDNWDEDWMKLFLSILAAGANFNRLPSVTLTQENGTLGRSENNTLVLPDSNRWISGQHAVIKYQAPDYYLTDTSTNGVLFKPLNQSPRPLGNGNTIKLNDGDQFEIGDYVIAAKLIENVPKAVNPTNKVLTDETFNLSDDPFSDFNMHSIKEIIEENDLYPNNQVNRPQSPDDLLDFSFLDSASSKPGATNASELPDFEHIPPNKEIYQPKLKNKINQPSSEAQSVNLTDIFTDEWPPILPDSQSKKTQDFPTPVIGDPPFPTPTLEPPTNSVHFGPQEELINQFLKGIGLESPHLAETLTPQSFYIIGKILKESIQGTRDILIGRAKIKNEMHLDVTLIKAKDNNPIKFSVSTEEALIKLLIHQDKGYLEPQAAIKEAFDDIRAHQYAVIAGMRTALLAVLKRFDPRRLEERLQGENPISASIPIHREAKLWTLFERLYQHIESEAKDNFYHLFGQAFAETYEQQMQNLNKSNPDSPLD
jgi:type VI secretion system protein